LRAVQDQTVTNDGDDVEGVRPQQVDDAAALKLQLAHIIASYTIGEGCSCGVGA
jgi:hypothetical protein